MIKLKVKILSSILLVGLIGGCASKQESVSFDDESKKVPKKEKKLDDKLSQIKSVNTAAKEGVVESNGNIVEKKINSKNQYINSVTSVIDGNSITLQSIHFGFDMYKLTDEMQAISIKNASKIKEVSLDNKNFKIKLEGNCDEWGTDEYNYALGLKRAKSVKKDLIKNGIASERIVVVSYGESNPLCTEQTTKCWKKNRRVDYKLLP